MWLLFLYFMDKYFTLVVLIDFMIDSDFERLRLTKRIEKSLHYADDSAAYQAR